MAFGGGFIPGFVLISEVSVLSYPFGWGLTSVAISGITKLGFHCIMKLGVRVGGSWLDFPFFFHSNTNAVRRYQVNAKYRKQVQIFYLLDHENDNDNSDSAKGVLTIFGKQRKTSML